MSLGQSTICCRASLVGLMNFQMQPISKLALPVLSWRKAVLSSAFCRSKGVPEVGVSQSLAPRGTWSPFSEAAMRQARKICRMLLLQVTSLPCSRTRLSAGSRMEMSTAMIPMTTSSSTRVKPLRRFMTKLPWEKGPDTQTPPPRASIIEQPHRPQPHRPLSLPSRRPAATGAPPSGSGAPLAAPDQRLVEAQRPLVLRRRVEAVGEDGGGGQALDVAVEEGVVAGALLLRHAVL